MKIPNNKVRLVLCGFLAAIGAGLTTTAQAVLTVWEVSDGGNGHSYQVFASAGINWNDARDAAIGIGGHLVTITDDAEDKFVLDLILNAGLGQVWAGGYQGDEGKDDPAADWQWVTPETWDYANWSFDEPNDYYGPGSEQHLGLNWVGNQWNDEGNLSNLAGYVVEWSGNVAGPRRVPDGGTTAILMGASLMGLYFFRRK